MYHLSFPKREIEERFVRCVCCLFMEQRKHRTFLANRFIYMMEFILNGTAEEALQQISAKHYALPSEADERKLFKIGINFSEKTRNIERWVE